MKKSRKDSKRYKYSGSDSGSSVMRVIVVLFFIILFAVGASMFISQNAVLSRVTTRADALADKQSEASLENEEVKALQKRIGSDVFIEDMARNQLGMVKPGEVVFET